MKHNGFTLIEVLIALAILSIAVLAILKSTSQTIRDAGYLQNKIIAQWVAIDVLNETRLGLLEAPQTAETLMLGETWQWETTSQPTKNPRIEEIHVVVSKQSQPLASLVSYRHAKKN